MEQTQSLPQQKQAPASRKIIMVVGLALLLGLIAIFAINMQTFESVDLQSRPAPEFTLPLYDRYGSEPVALAELRGQPVVVNFWASWCTECYREAALLEQAYKDYKDQGVVFLGVAHLDTEKDALAYLDKYGVTYPSGPDLGDKISQSYGITGVPETFLIDREGNIVHVQIGPVEHNQFYNLLDKLVAKTEQGS